jgi:hypothetical protein
MDHGTWRRIRAVPFKSLFTENPVNDDPLRPYQFPIDPFIDEKFPVWKEVFMAMLVKRACETDGIVEDCGIVKERSDEYRNEQDSISKFVKDMVVRESGKQIKKSELNHAFKLWFSENINNSKMPAIKEIHEYMDNHYGKQVANVWKNVKLFVDRSEDDGTIEKQDISYPNEQDCT